MRAIRSGLSKIFQKIVKLKNYPLNSIITTSSVNKLYNTDKEEKLTKRLKRKGLKYYKQIKFVDHSDYSLLHRVIADNKTNLFDKLFIDIPYMARPEVIEDRNNKLGMTPVQLSCMNRNVYFLSSLIDLGCDHKVMVNGKMNLLHLSTYSGNVNAIEFLIKEMKFSVHDVTIEKQTSLHIACIFNKIDSVNLLIEHGSNLYARDDANLTPVELACLSDNQTLLSILIEHHYSLKKLYEFNETNQKSVKLLHLAATCKIGTKCLAYLCKDTTNINEICNNTYLSTPLHFAVIEGNTQAVRVLLQSGALVSAVDYLGNSPLHYATEIGKVDIIRMLVEFGAKIHLQNKEDLTPSQIAMAQDNKEVKLYYLGLNGKNKSELISEDYLRFKSNKNML